MKRMLISGTAALMAAAAFAAPAQAQALDFDMAAPCTATKPVTECVRDAVNNTIDFVNSLGPLIGDACEIVFPSCRFPTP